ncbi:MAG: cysteine desulfurase [Acholeplasmatales bacterium]|jgi:cysteine desulfurase/selenocysteine lyase|nr:cysteine desulfurase [Acholeplasmatales bacterium]MDD7394879.1 cysteine desulfurase [Acholeplasmatales bacterium]MDY4016951.1 cysteine desulfurase [Bacilli bacterium]CDD22263.1 cysteine desulfurase [Firmicutes bacterium CAG:313]HCX08114.1 cysteine desulfurase [Acholeplasmatales bacterium]
MADLLNIKKDFPVLNNNPDLVYLDTGATALKPKCVIDKINEYYDKYGVNVNRGVYELSYEATTEYEETRTLTAKFLNAREKEIVFTKGASNGLNMVALGFGMDYIQEGDEIITTELEHHSNVLPWMNVAKKKNATLKYIELDSTGRITVEAFKKTITEKSKVLAITYVSNVMGYITPIKEIIKIAHEHNIIVVVDAAQAVPHMKVDVQDLDCDFLAFSAHKMFGPTGFGILFGKYKYLKKMSPIEYGGDMIDVVEKYEATTKDAPYKFETGTPPIAEAIAFKEAIKYIESIGYDRIHEHEQILLNYAREKLSKVEGITIYNPTAETAIITFNINKAHPHDAATIFDEYHVALRAGHHCAQLITKWLDCVATLRACIYVYNDYHDIDVFVEAVKAAVKYFEEW